MNRHIKRSAAFLETSDIIYQPESKNAANRIFGKNNIQKNVGKMKNLIRFTLAIVGLVSVFAAVGITDGNQFELPVRAIGALVFGACAFAIYRIDNPKNRGNDENN